MSARLTPAARSWRRLSSRWRAELRAVPERRARRKGARCKPFIREFDLPRRPFEELIDGVEMDLAHVRYQTFARWPSTAGASRRRSD